jgi:hypothetical protein
MISPDCSLPRILESIEINASQDRVWEVISDLDGEPRFWRGTRSVKNLSRDGNVVRREIYQNFGNHAIQQKVILNPKTEIEVQYLKGITEGTKKLRINLTGQNSQKLTAEWDVKFSGIYKLGTPFITGHVRKGTKEALQRIKDVLEGRKIEEAETVTKSA